MFTSHYKFYILTLLVCYSTTLYSQELSTILEQKPFTFSGSMNVNQTTTFRNVNYTSSNPYSIFLNGNATLNFYGITFPFSFSYSNQQVNYSQPFSFNQFGAQPSYKWVKAYIGYNSMSFSPYSLNGHQFLGGGVELTPPDIGLKFSLMYGRLIKAVEWDKDKPTLLPYYERIGYATKIGYTGKAGNYEISLFKSFDKKNSINPIPDSLGVKPQENMVYTIKAGKTFFEKFKIAGEYAGSALTQDTRQKDNESQVSRKEFFLIQPNATTSYSSAFKGSVDYLGSTYTVGVAYERIEPNYSTLGAYYNNNDLENVALTATKQLMQGKLNLAGSAGSQRNNLDNSKLSTSNQFLGSLNVSYAASQRLNLNTSYSNYSYFTYMKTPFDQINTTDPYKNLDTLNFTQISQTVMMSSAIVLGALDNKERRKMIMTSLSYQQSVNKQEGNKILNSSYFYQANVSYSYSIVPANLSISGSILGSYSYIPNVQKQIMAGPVVGINKSLLGKKMTTNCSLAYNFSFKNGDYTSGVYSLRVGGGYTHQKVHRVSLSLAAIYKDDKLSVSNSKTFEFTGNLTYSYSFDSK